ncbi:MAG TPA: aspartate/glutamate racemase family protein [Jatrophihabitans sp.]|jgi:aspartate/glutamate racemase|nr:aspartate/glutamate racemase family protein [Jatrophihabitans sp.]
MTTAGVLHTVPALATTFDTLIGERAADVRRVHVVDAWLLQTARREGVTDAVRAAVAEHVAHLAASGADAVLVTCSSIGEAAEVAAADMAVPVLRVDAAMAEEAVDIASAPTAAGRVAVLATLTSTLDPTSRLVQRAAHAAGRSIEVATEMVTGASDANDAGDRATADELIAAAVERVADAADVIVLAQASMAGAAQSVSVDVPVLTSPAGGVRALLAALP